MDTACNLCLGQEGPLSVGSCCGHQASCGISNIRLILTTALEQSLERTHPWNWWLGRLSLMEKLLTRFSWEFLLPQCMLKPLTPPDRDSDTDDSHSGTMSDVVSLDSVTSSIISSSVLDTSSPESMDGLLEPEIKHEGSMSPGESDLGRSDFDPDSMSPIVQNNLLMQCWYFAARATHTSHHKVAKVARRVIIRIAKVLRDDPSSLEIINDVISKCHRTMREGLLDKMLQAREKPQESMVPQKNNAVTKSDRKVTKRRLLHSPNQPVVPVQRQLLGADLEPRNLSRELSEDSSVHSSLSDIDVERSLSLVVPQHQSSPTCSHGDGSPQSIRSHTENPLAALEISEDELVTSGDSFQSAVSELDRTLLEGEVIKEDKSSEGTEEGSSSTSNSHDSRSGDQQLRSDSGGSIASGGGVPGGGVTLGDVKRTLNAMR